MPTYQYRCKSCSYEFEELEKISDQPLKTCPSCKKDSVVRIFAGGSGLVFKGSGFYQTDYKKSVGEDKEKSTKKEEKKSETKTEPKTETKSETKSESSTKKPTGDSKSDK